MLENILTHLEASTTGAAFRAFFRLPLYLLRLRKKYPIARTWYEYHVSLRRQNPVVVPAELKIRKGLTYELVAELGHANEDELQYKGRVTTERSEVVIMLTSTSHPSETLYYRFHDPISSGQPVPGLWLSFDFDGNTACGAALLSPDPLAPETVQELFKSHFRRSPQDPAIRIIR